MNAKDERDGTDMASVMEEIRKTKGTTSLGRAIALRALGVLVMAVAVWVIAMNVTWVDTLVLQRTDDRVVLDGVIEGDWRAASVNFRVKRDADGRADVASIQAVRAVAPALAQAFEESIGSGRPLLVTAERVRFFGGRTFAEVPSVSVGDGLESSGAAGADPLASLRVARIEWRPGMGRTLREIDVVALLPALLFLVLASLCVATRWWRLLALNDCPTRWYDAFRYTYSGLFFNAVVPGINGGDVARAVAVVRDHPDRRGDAFMTVVVDRVIGLVGMVIVGTALVLMTDDRLASLKVPVAAFCAVLLVGAGLFFAPFVRRLVRFEDLAMKLPQGERLLRLDAGARRLLRAPLEVLIALVFSFGNHIFNGLAVFVAARALGSDLGFADWMTTMAIANTLAAVPLSPGGLGVGEVLFGSLAEMLGSTYAIGVATSLVYRLALYGMSLLGGLVMLLPNGSRPRPSAANDDLGAEAQVP